MWQVFYKIELTSLKVEKNPTDGRDKPNKDVVIVDCGGEEVRVCLLISVKQFLLFFEGIILAFRKITLNH